MPKVAASARSDSFPPNPNWLQNDILADRPLRLSSKINNVVRRSGMLESLSVSNELAVRP